MMPDIEQHLELLAVILAVILGVLNRLLKKRSVNLRLTIEDIPENSSDLNPNIRTKEAAGRKTASKSVVQQQERRRKDE